MNDSADKRELAQEAIAEAKRAYRATGNPVFVIQAISAARSANERQPAWAVRVIVEAATRAWDRHSISGGALSVDRALGIIARKGGRSPAATADRHIVESNVFDQIKIIHSCFDVPIPEACEIVHSSIDFELARRIEENFSTSNDMQRTTLSRFVTMCKFPPKVAKKIMQGRWWEVSRGERLAYDLNQLIDQYHRRGTKRRYPDGSTKDETVLLYASGALLRATPERCAYEARISPGSRIVFKSKLKSLRPRRGFAEYEAQTRAGWRLDNSTH